MFGKGTKRLLSFTNVTTNVIFLKARVRIIKIRQFVFIKSWNEWAESNYLEPDTEWGYSYLQAIKNVLSE